MGHEMPQSVLKLNGKTCAKLLSNRRSDALSMFFKRGRKLEFVKCGSLFHRILEDKSVETARVIGMRTDSGIPHVRYEVSVARRQVPTFYFEGPRTLALETFTDTYRERLPVG